MDATLPNEVNALRELASTLQGALAELKVENQLLRQKLEFFIKRYFGGTRNESLDPKQLELLLAGLEALNEPTPAAANPRRREPPRRVRHASLCRPTWRPSGWCSNRRKCSNSLKAGASWARK